MMTIRKMRTAMIYIDSVWELDGKVVAQGRR